MYQEEKEERQEWCWEKKQGSSCTKAQGKGKIHHLYLLFS